MMKYTFSIVIPVFNAERTFPETLISLARLASPPIAGELLFIDNGSSDNSKNLAERMTFPYGPVRVVSESKRGAYAARNRGVREATGDIIVFTDSDCIVDPQWLTSILQPLIDGTARIAGGPVLAAPPENDDEAYLQLIQIVNQERAVCGDFFGIPFVVTANAAYFKEDITAVDGFDEALHISGDADLAWRVQDYLRTKHLPGLTYVPSAPVLHRHRANLRQLLNQHYQYGFGWVELLQNNLNRFEQLAWVLPWEDREIRLHTQRLLRPKSLGWTPKDWRRTVRDVLAKAAHRAGAKAACKHYGIDPNEGRLPIIPKANQPKSAYEPVVADPEHWCPGMLREK